MSNLRRELHTVSLTPLTCCKVGHLSLVLVVTMSAVIWLGLSTHRMLIVLKTQSWLFLSLRLTGYIRVISIIHQLGLGIHFTYGN